MPIKEQVCVIRKAAVAGYFYPRDPQVLAGQIKEQASEQGDFPARGVILPHGPYQRCARIIGAVLSKIRIPPTCIILGGSHTDTLTPWNMLASGAYQTPLGQVPVNEAAAGFLRERCPFLEAGVLSQRGEHAIEVVLPFLQVLGPRNLDIVPIIVNAGGDEEFAKLAEALKALIEQNNERFLLIASSDLSHYEPCEELIEHDRLLLEAIQHLDENDLAGCIDIFDTKMCGYGAVVSLLKTVKLLGSSNARLVEYDASSASGGDPDSAIGYAGLVIE